MENARLARATEAKHFINDLLKSDKPAAEIKQLVDKLKTKPELRKAILSEDAISDIPKGTIKDIKETKSAKEIVFHFFGMNDNWKLGRNLIGGLFVHAPEYPTYFIPAFIQAKATGDATDLKKGEGPRGLLTGGLEGIAVGALVSGRKMKLREMVPYIVLGMALQLLSSKLFPWLGEKMGRKLYHKKNNANLQQSKINELEVQNPTKQIPATAKKPEAKQTFKGRNIYDNYPIGNLKI